MANSANPDKVTKPNLLSRFKGLRRWQKALVIFLGFFIVAGVFSDPEETTQRLEDATASIEETTADLEEYVADEEGTPQTETVEEWKEVIKVSGSADKKTEPFSISGKRWKVIYTITGDNDYATFYATSYEPGDDFGDSIVMGADESGETIMYTKGEFYLDMSSANCSWTVTVQELVEVEKPIE